MTIWSVLKLPKIAWPSPFKKGLTPSLFSVHEKNEQKELNTLRMAVEEKNRTEKTGINRIYKVSLFDYF